MGAPVRLGVTGGVVFFLGFIIGFWGFHKILHAKIGEAVGLKKGSEIRELWSNTPIAVDFKMYLFNITNPDEVHKGAKPIVNEIGPYFYDEWKSKVDLVDDAEADTVSFNMKNKWIFNVTQSKGLTGEEIITLPHMALLGMSYMVERTKPGALALVAKSVDALFNGPQTAFITARARELLFDGIPINCTSQEFSVKAICTQIRANPKGLVPMGKDIFLFSFFGARNNTKDPGRFTVSRGIKNPKDVGRMVMFDGKPEQDVWSGPECNKLKGTDSTIFPPFLTPDEPIESFAPDLCRSIAAKFHYKAVYKNIPSYYYTAGLGDMSTDEELKCFCPAPDKCLKRGLFDITKCAGAPVILSLPHFYDVDESYHNHVIGLHPEAEKHQIFLYFEPITGTPLVGRKRLQFNIELHPVKKIAVLKQLPTALTPVMWVEEGLELDQEFLDILDAKLFRSLRIVGVGKYIVMLIGIGLIGAGFYLHHKRKNMPEKNPSSTTKTTPIDTISSAEKF